MENDLLTPHKAAKLKGVSRTAIYSAIAEGRLKHIRILGRIAIKREHLLAWTPLPYAGRRKGTPMSDEAKSHISEGQKRRWAERKQQQST